MAVMGVAGQAEYFELRINIRESLIYELVRRGISAAATVLTTKTQGHLARHRRERDVAAPVPRHTS
jgi:hypothetical protein